MKKLKFLLKLFCVFMVVGHIALFFKGRPPQYLFNASLWLLLLLYLARRKAPEPETQDSGTESVSASEPEDVA